MHLSRRLELHVTEVREHLDMCVVVEPEASLVASALNQVSWHIYDLRRRLVRDLRAKGTSWAVIGKTMGISKQSAHSQWHTVDGEIGRRWADRYPSTVERVTDSATVFGRREGDLIATEAVCDCGTTHAYSGRTIDMLSEGTTLSE